MKTLPESISKSIKKNYWVFFALVVAFSLFNLFYRLDALPVQDWDEGREGITAYEMVQSGDLIRTTYLGQTDYDNTKPPLLFWTMGLSYQVFGFNIFAFRFPSALFGFLTILLIMLTAKKYYNEGTSLFSGIILSTSYAFIHYHSARRGDFDSLLVLLVTVSLIFILKADKRKTYFYLSAFFAGLAFLTKSFAAFQIFAIAVLYLWFSGRTKKLKWTDWFLYFGSFLLPVLVWGFFRYQADGFAFFQSMISNDLVQRTTGRYATLPTFPLWYFGILFAHFFPWSLFLLTAFFYRNRFETFVKNDVRRFKFNLNKSFRQPLFALWAAVPFVLFSLITGKLAWYINAIYPPLAVLLGWYIANAIRREDKTPYFLGGMRMLVVIAVFILSYETAFIAIVTRQNSQSEQNFLKNMDQNGGDTNSIYFVNRYENHGERFLAAVLKHYKIQNVHSDAEFINRGVKGDLLYLNDTSENRIMAATNHFKIMDLDKKAGLMVVGK